MRNLVFFVSLWFIPPQAASHLDDQYDSVFLLSLEAKRITDLVEGLRSNPKRTSLSR
jgi:hypothetical protein